MKRRKANNFALRAPTNRLPFARSILSTENSRSGEKKSKRVVFNSMESNKIRSFDCIVMDVKHPAARLVNNCLLGYNIKSCRPMMRRVAIL